MGLVQFPSTIVVFNYLFSTIFVQTTVLVILMVRQEDFLGLIGVTADTSVSASLRAALKKVVSISKTAIRVDLLQLPVVRAI